MATIHLELDKQILGRTGQAVALQQASLEQLLQEIIKLPEGRFLELLEFIKFLQFKEQVKPPPLNLKSMPQQEILGELDRIRERVQQNHGIYDGDALAEVRTERERQTNRVFGLGDE